MSDLDKINSIFNANTDTVKLKKIYKILKLSFSEKMVKLQNSLKL